MYISLSYYADVTVGPNDIIVIDDVNAYFYNKNGIS